MVEQPIAGRMSDRPSRQVADTAQALVVAMADCGRTLNNAFVQQSLLSLVVIPGLRIHGLRISDKGLIDVTRFAATDLVVAEPWSGFCGRCQGCSPG